MSWAAPTRGLCPEIRRTISDGRPARSAIALKMRGTWLSSSASPTSPSLLTERNSLPEAIPLPASHARTSVTLSRCR